MQTHIKHHITYYKHVNNMQHATKIGGRPFQVSFFPFRCFSFFWEIRGNRRGGCCCCCCSCSPCSLKILDRNDSDQTYLLFWPLGYCPICIVPFQSQYAETYHLINLDSSRQWVSLFVYSTLSYMGEELPTFLNGTSFLSRLFIVADKKYPPH